MAAVRFATMWLGGCSGCHMSFLDMDEWLIDLSSKVDLVYGPLVDVKVFPENVDITLVEGAVANEDNLHMVRQARERSRYIIAFGDCAVTGNVTALRNPLGVALEVLKPVYLDNGDLNPRIPDDREIVPILLDNVKPVHAVVPVDYYLPGCPPPADRIRSVLEALLEGRTPQLEGNERRFG